MTTEVIPNEHVFPFRELCCQHGIFFASETGPDHPLPCFDRESVSPPKGWKDPAKIENWYIGKEEAYTEKAALHPETGRILCIQYYQRNGTPVLDDGGRGNGKLHGELEIAMLTRFWETYKAAQSLLINMVGFNILRFDLPFFIKRSWKLGVEIPHPAYAGNRADAGIFRDLILHVGCGNRDQEMSLAAICRFLGLPEKGDEGKRFHKLWFGTPEEHMQARQYAINDVLLTADVATATQFI